MLSAQNEARNSTALTRRKECSGKRFGVDCGTTQDIGVLFNKSGSRGNRINYWAYPGEQPVLDFFNLTPQARVRGFSVRADWLHFRGLELGGVQQILTTVNESWGIRVESGR